MTASYARPKVVLASGNAGKVREFNQLLGDQHIEVVPQSSFGVPEAEETGLTFVENAILKARNAARHTGLPALADDSGIEVDALNGAPGIYSARYAGAGASDEANLRRLLAALEGVPDAERGARFQCVIAYLRHEQWLLQYAHECPLAQLESGDRPSDKRRYTRALYVKIDTFRGCPVKAMYPITLAHAQELVAMGEAPGGDY